MNMEFLPLVLPLNYNMYFNRYNIGWTCFLAVFFFISYGSVNHLTAYMDTLAPVSSFVFRWEKYVPFIPAFIFPYMSIDILYGLAFFIIPKTRYSDEKYKKTIHSLGIQLLVNQVFTLICFLSFPLKFSFAKPDIAPVYKPSFDALLSFDLPYNQSPSLHISLVVILMVFYCQHLKTAWIKYALNLWFILIGASVLFVYQHHIVDVFMGLFCGLAVVLLFNNSPQDAHAFHINHEARKTKLFKVFTFSLGIGALAIFILPIAANFHLLNYRINQAAYIVLWGLFVSFISVYKVMFWGNSFNIRNAEHRFTKTFYLVAYPYMLIRLLSIRPFNYYKVNLPILPQLNVGNLISIKNHKYQPDDIIINLSWECDNQQANTITYPMIDLISPNISQVKTICEEIHQQINNGKNVYVHCALGIFRTIFVVSSYLILYEKYKPQEVIEYLATLDFDPRLQSYIVKNKARYEKILLNL